MSVNPPNTRRNNWKETLTPIPTRGVYKQSAKQFSPKSTIPWHCADCWCLHMLSCTHFSLKAVYVKWTTPQKTILPCGNAKVQRLKAYDLIARPKNKRVILPHKASCHVKKLNFTYQWRANQCYLLGKKAKFLSARWQVHHIACLWRGWGVWGGVLNQSVQSVLQENAPGHDVRFITLYQAVNMMMGH